MNWKRATSNRLWALLTLGGIAYSAFTLAGVRAARAAETSADAAARNLILESPAWRQAMEGFNEWLSAQSIYDKRQIPQVAAQVRNKIAKMTASQLQDYLLDMQQKLAIIHSKAASDAQAMVDYNLTVASNAYAAKLRKELPDLATMTAGQVQQCLFDLQQQQADTRAQETAFQSTREQQLALVRAANQRTADAQAAAAAEMSSGGGNYSDGLYAPRPIFQPVYDPAPIYFGWPW